MNHTDNETATFTPDPMPVLDGGGFDAAIILVPILLILSVALAWGARSLWKPKHAVEAPTGTRVHPWTTGGGPAWTYQPREEPLIVNPCWIGHSGPSDADAFVADLKATLERVYPFRFAINPVAHMGSYAELEERARISDAALWIGLTLEAFLSAGGGKDILGQAYRNIILATPRLCGDHVDEVVAHELGHIMGLPHKAGTLMDAQGRGHDSLLDAGQREVVAAWAYTHLSARPGSGS